MKIKRIKLKDWGRHRDLDETMDAQVVGLMGANGSGKTLVLKALEYALTGMLDDKAETYVRDFGQGTVKNASVTVWFEKDGRDGVIFRQVGATARRKLEWDGMELTKAKDVEDALGEIFGADRQAVSNAVFVSQGELDRMLFGTPAEREALWLKLMLLNFMDARHDLIDRKIKLLGAGLQDFTMHMDELNAQISEAELIVGAKDAELRRTPDLSDVISSLEALVRSHTACAEAGRDLASSQAQARETRSSLNVAMAQLHKFQFENCGLDMLDAVNLTQLREIRDQMAGEQARVERELAGARALQTLKAAYLRGMQEKLELEQKQQGLDRDLRNLGSVDGFKERIERCIAGERAASAALSTQTRLKTAREANTQAAQALLAKTAGGKPWPDSELVEHAMKLAGLTSDFGLLDMKVKVCGELAKHVAQGDTFTACPVCGADTDHMDPNSDLDGLRAALARAQDALKEAKEQQNRMTVENTRYVRDLEVLQEKMRDALKLQTQLEAELASHELNSAGRTCNDWGNERTELESKWTLWCAADRDAAINRRMLEAKITELDRITADPDWERAKSSEAGDILRAEAEKNRVERVSDTVNNQMSIIDDLVRKADALDAAAASHMRTLDRLKQAVDAATATLQNNGRADLVAACELEQAAVVGELKIRQQARNELQGELTQAQRQAGSLRDKRTALEARVAADARMRALIEHLRQLKETLARGGLPMAYMNYTFGLIVDRARTHLGNMGANFDVSVDTSKSLSMQFTRTDDTTGFSLPQEKLSGGQKVRLSVAVLLAVQSLLLSEVGLLVLDEPSNHMDEEGVERLRDLLFDVGRHLGTTDMQMLVCDHKEQLVPAFGSVIRVK